MDPCPSPRGPPPPPKQWDAITQSSFGYFHVPLSPYRHACECVLRDHMQVCDAYCADTGRNLDLAISVHHCHPAWLWILSKKKKKALICYAVRMGLFLACWGSQLWNLCLRISPLFNNAGCADQNSNSTVLHTSVSSCSMGWVGGRNGIWGRNSCSLAATLVTTRDKQSLELSKHGFINALNFAWLYKGEGELEVSESPGGLVKTAFWVKWCPDNCSTTLWKKRCDLRLPIFRV